MQIKVVRFINWCRLFLREVLRFNYSGSASWFCDTNPRLLTLDWCPDITLIRGARDGNLVLADAYAICPSVVTRAALPAACHNVMSWPLTTAALGT